MPGRSILTKKKRRIIYGRKEEKSFQRTNSYSCFLHPFWTVSGTDACGDSECALQGSIWSGTDRGWHLPYCDFCAGKR